MPEAGDIPDAEFSGRNLDERMHVAVDEVHVCEWTPARDGHGKSTEVHLVLDVHAFEPEVPLSIVMAFKSADAVDRMIATLMRHRNGVWGGGEG